MRPEKKSQNFPKQHYHGTKFSQKVKGIIIANNCNKLNNEHVSHRKAITIKWVNHFLNKFTHSGDSRI